jgi:hypothetical protein
MVTKSRAKVIYEVVESRGVVDEWRVEGIDYDKDGLVYVTIFSGPDSKHRADEYADWKNS